MLATLDTTDFWSSVEFDSLSECAAIVIVGLDDVGENVMRAVVRTLHLSAHGNHRVLKLARTIAELAGEERVHSAHIAEAMQYRSQQLMTELTIRPT
jgi:predicted ATPase with chaperone activity